MEHSNNKITNEFYRFISHQDFPCIIARSMTHKKAIRVMVAGHIGCPSHDQEILDFIYEFVIQFRKSSKGFQSVAVIFNASGEMNEDAFELFMWNRLTALRKKDAGLFEYDKRVADDPASADFSFSLMEEAFFVLALHPQSSRMARQFNYPVLIFNPHIQFEQMKKTNAFEKIKNIVRKRDIKLSGSINPMLTDFGSASEATQYSGKIYKTGWKCPLGIKNKL